MLSDGCDQGAVGGRPGMGDYRKAGAALAVPDEKCVSLNVSKGWKAAVRRPGGPGGIDAAHRPPLVLDSRLLHVIAS
jgi:hypothetical protein